MTGAWGSHQAAAAIAIDQVGRLQEALSMATEASETAMGAIAEATGESRTESANNAMAFIAGIKERINESYGMAQSAVAELERYAGGF